MSLPRWRAVRSDALFSPMLAFRPSRGGTNRRLARIR